MFNQRTRRVVFCSGVSFGLMAIVLSSERLATTVRSGSVQAFQGRVSDYTRLRRQIVEGLQTDGLAANAPETAFRQALASAIREERRHARTGDVFGLEMADRILRMVRDDMSTRGPTDREGILFEVPAVASVRVNDCYPDGAPIATMPPLLLMRLVPLPPELQYRFLGDAVILLDIDANLIVDVIPNALRQRS